MPPVNENVKVLIERIFNTRFSGNPGGLTVDSNPNVWTNHVLYSSDMIHEWHAADAFKDGNVTNVGTTYTFEALKAYWRDNEFVGRYLEISGRWYPIESNAHHTLTIQHTTANPPVSTRSWKIVAGKNAAPTLDTAVKKHKNWLMSEDSPSLYATDSDELEALSNRLGEKNSNDANEKRDHLGVKSKPGKQRKKARRFAGRVNDALATLESGSKNLELAGEDMVGREVLSIKLSLFERKAQVEGLLKYLEDIHDTVTEAHWDIIAPSVYAYIDSINLGNPDNHDFY